MSGQVQTRETTRELAEVDRVLLRGRIESIYAYMEQGNIDGVLSLLTHDIVCFPKNTWRHAHFPRQIVGKEAMREALYQRHVNYIVMKSVVHRVLIDGGDAVVYRSRTIQERGGSASHSFDCVDFFRFREGLIAEISELPDGSAYDAVINFPH